MSQMGENIKGIYVSAVSLSDPLATYSLDGKIYIEAHAARDLPKKDGYVRIFFNVDTGAVTYRIFSFTKELREGEPLCK